MSDRMIVVNRDGILCEHCVWTFPTQQVHNLYGLTAYHQMYEELSGWGKSPERELLWKSCPNAGKTFRIPQSFWCIAELVGENNGPWKESA